ncbi:MAG TPA: carboxypeptidase regulatory-like domain-containing protein, partial [Archangium sp.]|uniref:carboxypeptidase regulatory-like domain-containing protein n=1 Tax=Archangium sp. TaxID=1872627 RepID=UPI002ED98139
MKKSLLIAACVLLAACQSPSISGTVTFEGEGDASGVVVSLVGPDETEVAITDATGAYQFTGVDDGTYQLTFVAPEATEESRRALAVVLKDGKGGEVPAVTLMGAGVVAGKVTAGTTTGNLGIQVSVAGTTLSAMTTDDGSFTLTGVPTGQRTLVATRGNYIASSTVTVQRGTRNAADFTLGKKGLRSGKVVGSVQYWDARAASDIQLSVPGVLEPTNAAANGAFSLTLPEGEWEIVATSPAYPRQVVARAKVSADGTTEVGIRKLSAFHRFSVKDPAQYNAYSRLFDDGVHALVSREGWENLTHSIVDLRTGEERMFLVEWNWVDDPTDWVATANGQFLAYGQSFGSYTSDGNYYGHSDFNVFNTTTAQHLMFRGERNSSPTSRQLWSFSPNGEFFFGIDTKKLHRMKTADGTLTSVPADHSVMKGDDEHFLALAYGAGGASVGSATFLDSQTNKTVVPNVNLSASTSQFGKYGLLMTDCDGSSNCDVKVVNLMTGAVATVTGGKYYQYSSLLLTNHA